MDNERLVINIRVTQSFLDRLETHLQAYNRESKFGLKLDRSKLMRSLAEEWMNNNDKGTSA